MLFHKYVLALLFSGADVSLKVIERKLIAIPNLRPLSHRPVIQMPTRSFRVV
jgi:hypothetical protein